MSFSCTHPFKILIETFSYSSFMWYSKQNSVSCRRVCSSWPFIVIGCCGGQELYNTSSQICCEFNGAFNVATKEKYCCYDKAFNAESQYCVKGQVLSFKENLCGNEIYNISEKKCCGDQTLYDMPQFLADCCGSLLFDVNKSQCCRGTKTVIPTNLECCGEGK